MAEDNSHRWCEGEGSLEENCPKWQRWFLLGNVTVMIPFYFLYMSERGPIWPHSNRHTHVIVIYQIGKIRVPGCLSYASNS